MGGWRCWMEVKGRQGELIVVRLRARQEVRILVEWEGVEVFVKCREEGGVWEEEQAETQVKAMTTPKWKKMHPCWA